MQSPHKIAPTMAVKYVGFNTWLRYSHKFQFEVFNLDLSLYTDTGSTTTFWFLARPFKNNINLDLIRAPTEELHAKFQFACCN